MFVLYRYVWQIGINEHRVELYSDYSKEIGLSNKISEVESTMATKILKYLREQNVSKD